MAAVRKGQYDFPVEEWSGISKEAKDLVSNMLKFDPKKRLSAKACLSHTWIKKYEQLSDSKITEKALSKMKKFKVIKILILYYYNFKFKFFSQTKN